VACGLAEVVGMAAAAACAGLALTVVGEPDDLGSAAATIAIATLGGVVEGAALGVVQLHVLRRWLVGLGRSFVVVTVAAAASGWFLGMLPSTIAQWASADAAPATSTPDNGPPLWLMPIAGLLAGALLGALFGALQAVVLRHHVSAARRWVLANLLGWSVALAVIMTSASVPSASWSIGHVLVLAAVTGIVAGMAVGAVTGLFLPAIDDSVPLPARFGGRMVCRLLRSPAHALLSGALIEVRYTGRRTGDQHVLPVQYAADGSRLVVWSAHSSQKVWWRNLLTPTPVTVVLKGALCTGTAQVVRSPQAAWAAAAHHYQLRFPRTTLSVLDPLVQIDLAEINPSAALDQVDAAPR
jgi:hypothetical protein